MARLHTAVAFSAACVALLVILQLLVHPGLARLDARHEPRDSDSHGKTHLMNERQDGDASQYLVGVGKADITG
jgi:hypothetical protein